VKYLGHFTWNVKTMATFTWTNGQANKGTLASWSACSFGSVAPGMPTDQAVQAILMGPQNAARWNDMMNEALAKTLVNSVHATGQQPNRLDYQNWNWTPAPGFWQ
jgi:hypothetical protein